MTDIRIDYQLLDEVRVRLGSLVAEFASIQTVQDRYDIPASVRTGSTSRRYDNIE